MQLAFLPPENKDRARGRAVSGPATNAGHRVLLAIASGFPANPCSACETHREKEYCGR